MDFGLIAVLFCSSWGLLMISITGAARNLSILRTLYSSRKRAGRSDLYIHLIEKRRNRCVMFVVGICVAVVFIKMFGELGYQHCVTVGECW